MVVIHHLTAVLSALHERVTQSSNSEKHERYIPSVCRCIPRTRQKILSNVYVISLPFLTQPCSCINERMKEWMNEYLPVLRVAKSGEERQDDVESPRPELAQTVTDDTPLEPTVKSEINVRNTLRRKFNFDRADSFWQSPIESDDHTWVS